MKRLFLRIFYFYYNGFRAMTLGKGLWVIILVKLFIMFGIFKLLFFPNFLGSRCENDQQKSQYVGSSLVERSR